MTDQGSVQGERVRKLIFWILILTWPCVRVADHLWSPAWYDIVDDLGAAVTFVAFILGRILYFNTQKDVCQRLRRNEQAINSQQTAMSELFPETVPTLYDAAVPKPQPTAHVSMPGSTPGGRLLAFRRR